MHPLTQRSALVLALSTFCSATTLAADEAEVIVTASRFDQADPRVPANISVITREDIRNTPALGLPDLLKTRAGIDVRTLYGSLGMDATVDLRGFGDAAVSNTLILLDGQRLNPVDMGSVSWSAIPLESIRRIEIIRGAGTVLYGDRASGGVINIITDKSGGQRATLSAGGGSHGYRSVDASGAGGSDQAYFNVFVHHAASDGWRQNSQQDQQALSGRLGFYLGAGEIFADYAAYKDSSGLPGYLRSAAYQSDPRRSNTPFDMQRRNGYRLRPGVKLPLSDTLTLEAELSGEEENQHGHYASSNWISDRAKGTVSFTPRLRFGHGLGRLPSETVFGLDYYTGDVGVRNQNGPNQSASQTSTAFYFQNSTAVNADWSVTLGGRSQRMEQRAQQDAYAPWFSPAMDGSAMRTRNAYDLGASYTGVGWRAYGKSGNTFRFANTDELFGFDPILFVPVFAGDLRPQHGTVSEVGGSVDTGPAQARASFYRMNLTDEIGYDGAVGANTNFAPTRRQGLEGELDWRLDEHFKARLSYARTAAAFRSGAYTGKEIPLVPRDKATLQLTWDAGRAGAYTAVANYVGERRYSGDFANVRDKLAGYTTLDLQAAWNIRPWTLTARLLNALDKRYSPFAGYSTGISDYYYYPADGRSFFLSARYDFK
jgi:iron complex outermembrane receptor protein